MPRPEPLGPLDDPTNYGGDKFWRGLNMRLDPDLLEPGYVSKAVNARFRDGVLTTRDGSMVIPWFNQIVSGTVRPWGKIYGRGTFRDPSTFREYELIAQSGAVYACQPNNAPVSVPLPAGETISDTCTFLQAFNVVLLLRGFDADPLVLENIYEGFKTIVQAPTGTGLLTIPRALRGVFAANRVFLLREDDTMVASDVNDYTHFSELDDFRVNQGDADKSVAIAVFGTATLVVLKQRTIYRIDNIFGDLSEITFSQVTRRYGCVAAETVVDCGSDLLWLCQEGVASLTLTIQNEIQSAQGALAGKFRMFSEPIGPLFERIKGAYRENAWATLWNDRYYIALPVDEAEFLGNELLFDTFSTTTEVIPVVQGATYRWAKGVDDTSLANGSDTYTTSRDFVAQGTTVTLNYLGAVDFTNGSLKRLYRGENNVLAHYDFQNQAWGGWDEASDIGFAMLFVTQHVNRERLFVVTHDGWVRLWEEGYADRLAVPYVDVEVVDAPALTGANPVANGDTIQVNGGTVVTADTSTGSNFATTWGALKDDDPLANNPAYTLWQAILTTVGYRQDLAGAWSAPNTFLRPIKTNAAQLSLSNALGIRFYSTNGVLPTVVWTGTWANVTYYTEQAVVTTIITRGYSNQQGELSAYNFLMFDAETWNASFDVSVLADGVNEEIDLGTVTKDRTRYYFPFDAEPYDITNVNNDFQTAGREDYSIEPDDENYEFTPGSGVLGNLHQAARESFDLKLSGTSAQVELTCRRGRIRLLQLRLTDTVDDRHAGPISA